ncbi:MAG: hexokinase [Treponema sp. CETP13]|nr:MAG: hexokinase [Treponema sp. CETP13]
MNNFRNVNNTVNAFLARHGMVNPNINFVIDGLLYDMQKGLDEGPGLSGMDASQEMIPTWTNPPKKTPKNQSVIVIDAGGTNFRSSLVTFDADGNPTISKLEKTSMPGIDHELSKKEFFDTIAANLDHLKNKSAYIGFCFSYAMEMTPDGDGKVINFSKEIKAKEVIGSLVGASLSDALVARGWNRPKKIIMLNDTVAALLAGAATENGERSYSSYIGFILGTGMNAAYIESDSIKKLEGIKDSAGNPPPLSQIIVCESGLYNKIYRSDFDNEFDKTTNTPGRYVTEKMCSGAYLGPVATLVIRSACSEGLFSDAFVSKFNEDFNQNNYFDAYDMDQFLYKPAKKNTKLGAIVATGSERDAATLAALLDAVINRSASLATALIASAVIKSGKGTNPAKPVCINCDGTTFYKTHNLNARIRGNLDQILTQQRHLYFEIVSIENDITLGSAVAAAVNAN